jgi:hypothetical protein
MSRYGKDDGTFYMGMFAAILAVIAFSVGYALRDQGVTLKIQTPTPTEVQR